MMVSSYQRIVVLALVVVANVICMEWALGLYSSSSDGSELRRPESTLKSAPSVDYDDKAQQDEEDLQRDNEAVLRFEQFDDDAVYGMDDNADNEEGSTATSRMLFRPRKGPKNIATTIPSGNRPQCPPNYFILGTKKGGTTALHRYLAASHPQIYPYKITPPPPHNATLKEQIQDATVGESLVSLRDGNRFPRAFPRIPANQIFGESYVSRIINEDGVLVKKCPQSRFFILLRDPVSRALSDTLMHARFHWLKLNEESNVNNFLKAHANAFEAQMKRVDPNLASNPQPVRLFQSAQNFLYEGAYVIHLRRLMNAGMDPSQLRIYFSKDMFQDTPTVITDALHHLGLNESFIQPQQLSEPFNARDKDTKTPVHQQLEAELEQRLRKLMAPFDIELAKFLGISPQELPWPVPTET